jgi:hypothetical protein
MKLFVKITRVGHCICAGEYCRVLSGECEYGVQFRGFLDYCAGPQDTKGYEILSIDEYLETLHHEKEKEIIKKEIEKFIQENLQENS